MSRPKPTPRFAGHIGQPDMRKVVAVLARIAARREAERKTA